MVSGLEDFSINIVAWYSFPRNSRILTVGYDSEGIRDYLIQRGIKAEAFGDDITEGPLFDYIILNDIAFGSKDYAAELKSFSDRLKPDGRLFFIKANRLGLRYLSGDKDPGTGLIFAGVNNYRDYFSGREYAAGRRGFTLGEIKEVLSDAELKPVKVYYPYPDHLYTTELYDDLTIDSFVETEATINYDEDRRSLFDEKSVAETLKKEGVLKSFMNSYLVIAARQETVEDQNFIKYSINRNEGYRAITIIRGLASDHPMVEKKPYHLEDVRHIKQIYENYEKLAQESWQIRPLEGSLREDENPLDTCFTYRFLKQESVHNTVKDILFDNALGSEEKADRIRERFEAFYSVLIGHAAECEFMTDRFTELFGNVEPEMKTAPCMNPANLDMIPENLFDGEEGFTVIDYEWVADTPVPASFILWRSINDIYLKLPVLEDYVCRLELLEKCGIGSELESCFDSWNTHYTLKLIGSGRLGEYSRGMIKTDINALTGNWKTDIFTSIYIDYGQGYLEENRVITLAVWDKDHYHCEFELPKDRVITGFRWDPVEGYYVNCSIKGGSGFKNPKALNAFRSEEGTDYFVNIDPNYQFGADGADTLVIDFVLSAQTSDDGSKLLDEYRNSENVIRRKNYELAVIKSYTHFKNENFDKAVKWCENRNALRAKLGLKK